jgi:glycosyltransferase involved in cell wall biosynthesis
MESKHPNPRVCLLTETYYPVIGGGETQARALAEGLVSCGLTTIVLTRRTDASMRKREELGGVVVFRLPPVGHQHLRKWGLLFTSLVMLFRLRQSYDVLFVSGFRVLGIAAVVACKLLGKRCVLKADSLGEMSGDFFRAGLAKLGLSDDNLLFRMGLRLRNWILKGADIFVAISSEIRAELLEQGIPSEQIQMIPNSVDVQTFHPVDAREKVKLRAKLGMAPDETIVIYTGRLVSYKGLPLLLQVWRQLVRNHRHSRLFLVGAGGLDLHNCERLLRDDVARHHLEAHVYFTGSVDNVHEYLQASDIFVFPTENEAFGIALIEAMACGLPTISTAVGGIKDIVRHHRNGLLIPPGDFQALEQALDGLLCNQRLAGRLGQAAWETVYEKYATQTVLQQYTRLFRKGLSIL